ncbi:hypothetical protein, partial [Mycobacteroides abscessus]|uniref:hypothetical protein n=1 Tax=Mycobacteroides abscessus TaxID=36809 RepID=UPI001A7E065C
MPVDNGNRHAVADLNAPTVRSVLAQRRRIGVQPQSFAHVREVVYGLIADIELVSDVPRQLLGILVSVRGTCLLVP